MSWKSHLAAGVAAAALSWPALAAADEATDARIRALEAQLADMQAQLADLKAAAVSKPPPAPVAAAPALAPSPAPVRSDPAAATVSLANGRPVFASADGQFTAALRGVFQLDAAQYDQSRAGPLGTDWRRGSLGDATENDRARDLGDGVNFRRSRIGVEGKAFGQFEYNFLYEFGGAAGNEEAGKIVASWVQYNGIKALGTKLRIGAFSPPSGLDETVPTAGSLFVERAAVSEMVRSIAAGDGRTAVAWMGNGERWTAAAAITGNLVTTQTFDEQAAFVGRFTYAPFKTKTALIHLGGTSRFVR